MRLVLLAHPHLPRSSSLLASAAACGLATTVIAWHDWLLNPDCLLAALDEPCWLKLDAISEDAACQSRLIAHEHTLEHGEFAHADAAFAGFQAALQTLKQQLAHRPWARCLNSIDDILGMTDKWHCQHRLQQQGVPVPRLLGLFSGFAGLQTLMAQQQLWRVFLKPRYGSSASGVIALAGNGRGQWSATSSLLWDKSRDKLFNSLHIQRYRNADVIALVNRLACYSYYAEHWIAKPQHQGHSLDWRVVALAGLASHRVARLSRTPLTNLHLGNQRGQAEDHLTPADTQRLEHCSQQVAACFPGSTVMGIDMIIRPRHVHVLEVNAFGDWLPNLLWQGQTVHQQQMAWLQQQGATA